MTQNQKENKGQRRIRQGVVEGISKIIPISRHTRQDRVSGEGKKIAKMQKKSLLKGTRVSVAVAEAEIPRFMPSCMLLATPSMSRFLLGMCMT